MLRRLERVFRCCSVCETMEDYQEGYLTEGQTMCLLATLLGVTTSRATSGERSKNEIRVVSGETNLIIHIDTYQL